MAIPGLQTPDGKLQVDGMARVVASLEEQVRLLKRIDSKLAEIRREQKPGPTAAQLSAALQRATAPKSAP